MGITDYEVNKQSLFNFLHCQQPYRSKVHFGQQVLQAVKSPCAEVELTISEASSKPRGSTSFWLPALIEAGREALVGE